MNFGWKGTESEKQGEKSIISFNVAVVSRGNAQLMPNSATPYQDAKTDDGFSNKDICNRFPLLKSKLPVRYSIAIFFQ